MKSDDFRTFMIAQVRAFNAWVWRDQMENPEAWQDEMNKEKWLSLFLDFIGDNFD